MAVDELISINVGLVQGYIGTSLLRWKDVLNNARDDSGMANDVFLLNLVTASRKQFEANWELMINFSSPKLFNVVPTITISSGTNGAQGSTIVHRRLDYTAARFSATELIEFGGGGNTIAAPAVNTVDPTKRGYFEGIVSVSLTAVAATGTYRGVVLYDSSGGIDGSAVEPIAWVVVIAP